MCTKLLVYTICQGDDITHQPWHLYSIWICVLLPAYTNIQQNINYIFSIAQQDLEIPEREREGGKSVNPAPAIPTDGSCDTNPKLLLLD